MLISSSHAFRFFLYWLILAGLILFFLFVSWDLGALSRILQADLTRISVIVLFLLGCGSVHCGFRSWFLTQQLRMAEQLNNTELTGNDRNNLPYREGKSLVQDYLWGLKSQQETDNVLLAEVMAEKMRGSHQVGWFVSGMVIKLGLLGTVIGFVMMLGSVSELENLDISDIKDLMQQMTQGMGVAMTTTMVGLVSSMLLGMQYLLLDRCADQIVFEAVRIGQNTLPEITELNAEV